MQTNEKNISISFGNPNNISNQSSPDVIEDDTMRQVIMPTAFRRDGAIHQNIMPPTPT
jgi:hypothetical protein